MATNARVIDFLSLLGLLNLAEQFLICSIERSIQNLHDNIVRLRDEEGSQAADEIAVLRAEITYSRTIQVDFLQEIIDISPRIRNQRTWRAHQRHRNDGGAILHTITNTQRPQYQPRRMNENDHPTTQPHHRTRGRQMGNHHPTHIKGAAKWVDYNEPNRSCYVVRSPGNAAEEWPIELINGKWYLLTWENTRWRTKASRRLNNGDRKALNLGWFHITDAEHPDYHPLFAAPEKEEPELTPKKSKGKEAVPRPPSTNIHSPQDPEPAVRDESKTSEEERELSQESPGK